MPTVVGPSRDLAFLPAAAQALAANLLAGLQPRWTHTQAVAARALAGSAAVEVSERPVLVAAAWLHDIGYADEVRHCGFHPLDGAQYLQTRGWPHLVAALVAQHSGASFVAADLGLSAELAAYDEVRAREGALADALTWADQTTTATGERTDVGRRLADVLRRHGPDSPNARCHRDRAPALRAAVQRTEARLRQARC